MEFRNASSQPVPILLYIPVIHNGYLQFFERHARESSTLWLISSDLAAEFSTLHTEIRAVSSFKIKRMIEALNIFRDVKILDGANAVNFSASKIITATENISRQVVVKYFPESEVVFDTVFLRYDESNVKSLKPVIYDRLSENSFDREMMALAYNVADKSSCWWRHVGSVLVGQDHQILSMAHNQHVPSEHVPYVVGDPRDFIEAGQLSHFASTLHSEQMIILEILNKGISTAGTELYVSVFPCPACANLIAYSGIKRCFFGSGHASLSGQEVLKSKGVELIYVPIL